MNISDSTQSYQMSFNSPEIAICLEKIDRMNPKKTYKFRIPALTPDMTNTTAIDKKIPQKNTAIANKDNNIEIGEVNLSNYLEVNLPRELLSYIGQEYNVHGTLSIDGNGGAAYSSTESYSGSETNNGTISIDGQSSLNGSGNMSLNGSGNMSLNANGDVVGVPGSPGSVDVSGTGSANLSGSGSANLSGSGSISGSASSSLSVSGNTSNIGSMHIDRAWGSYGVKGRLFLEPVDRYILENSQWIVIFIGGDVNKPRIIGRY